MTVKKVKDIVLKKGTRSSSSTITEIMKKDSKESKELSNKISDWLFPLQDEIRTKTIPVKRELTTAENKVYNAKLKKGIPGSHPSMPGNQKSFTSKQLFIIPKREISIEEELKKIDNEIKHHITEMSKIDYKKYPIEIVKGIRESILMSRNTIASLKSSKK
jgi:hypothetical protein